MNEKEIGEIRRRIRRDRSNMTAIYGCYVNGEKEIVSEFKQSAAMMSENEADKYFGTLKKVLSGRIGRNLIDLTFKTSQVQSGEEHKLLMQLRNSNLQNEEARQEFYKKVIETVPFSDGYVIILGSENYDVPFKSKDDVIQSDSSDEVYSYVLCAVCPVKLTKSTLRYVAEEKLFRDGGANNVVCPPEIGFLFPAFDDRSANIYNALYYTRSPKENHELFVESIFNCPIPKPATEQKKDFDALLSSSLEDGCSLEVMQTVHEQICQSIEMHKESKVSEPLLITKELIKDSLATCDLPEKNIAKFSVEYDNVFGADAELHPRNIIDNKRFEVKMADVSIKVNPEKRDLIQTRVIGGVKYLLICADDSVEVNGVPIHISEETEE